MFARLCLLILISTSAFAQAFVPPEGTTSVAIGIQHTNIESHTFFDGREVPDVDIRSNTVTVTIDYSVTDRLALGFSLPYVSSQLRWAQTPHPGTADDGKVHGTLQDMRVDARYMALEGPVVVSPTLSWSQPVRDYEVLGHAAAGRGLEELELGVSWSAEVPPVPGLFLSGRGAYTFVERVDPDVNIDRANAALQVGYAVVPRLFLHVFGSWHDTRDGVNLPLSAHDREHHFHHHDQLLKARYVRGGAGLSFAVKNTVEVFVTYGSNVRSRNAHSGDTIGIGTSWTFSPRMFLARHNAARQLRSRDSAF